MKHPPQAYLSVNDGCFPDVWTQYRQQPTNESDIQRLAQATQYSGTSTTRNRGASAFPPEGQVSNQPPSRSTKLRRAAERTDPSTPLQGRPGQIRVGVSRGTLGASNAQRDIPTNLSPHSPLGAPPSYRSPIGHGYSAARADPHPRDRDPLPNTLPSGQRGSHFPAIGAEDESQESHPDPVILNRQDLLSLLDAVVTVNANSSRHSANTPSSMAIGNEAVRQAQQILSDKRQITLTTQEFNGLCETMHDLARQQNLTNHRIEQMSGSLNDLAHDRLTDTDSSSGSIFSGFFSRKGKKSKFLDGRWVSPTRGASEIDLNAGEDFYAPISPFVGYESQASSASAPALLPAPAHSRYHYSPRQFFHSPSCMCTACCFQRSHQ
ncbi:hypothetical protein FA15DRAFT_709891 [Coprinopsis marcescibilis]|uniref:Uncharacterized protein n=1 Tax=Coprinopsis marcescibilis TaxID=230819 RepID=A0A5C3KEM9_COPMA|nr:hypothetical protein FA15DRAFT_709891 [Coprinopsis marcescibilis]